MLEVVLMYANTNANPALPSQSNFNILKNLYNALFCVGSGRGDKCVQHAESYDTIHMHLECERFKSVLNVFQHLHANSKFRERERKMIIIAMIEGV